MKFTTLVIVATLALASAHAEESTLKEGAKEVGHATGDAVRKVGETGKEVGKKVAEAARDVGHATRDGAKEFKKAVKGEGSAASRASSSSTPTEPAHVHKSATGS